MFKQNFTFLNLIKNWGWQMLEKNCLLLRGKCLSIVLEIFLVKLLLSAAKSSWIFFQLSHVSGHKKNITPHTIV